MCLAIPMRVVSVDGWLALCEAHGSHRLVRLLRLMHEDIRPGDHLAVHAGDAIERLSPERAAEAWSLYELMLAATAPDDEGPHAAGLQQSDRS
ncbi:MAG: HypC/HybG/HupF family hydrogenase formation chaperone [Burkholderiales bacterium]|nr:HypC/HybG/HupF family hydrogenase formation chaperone [Burkholderiales bacterium]